jgi:hypothetical protein
MTQPAGPTSAAAVLSGDSGEALFGSNMLDLLTPALTIYSVEGAGRFPKIAVPTRTIVAPSSMAASKS